METNIIEKIFRLKYHPSKKIRKRSRNSNKYVPAASVILVQENPDYLLQLHKIQNSYLKLSNEFTNLFTKEKRFEFSLLLDPIFIRFLEIMYNAINTGNIKKMSFNASVEIFTDIVMDLIFNQYGK